MPSTHAWLNLIDKMLWIPSILLTTPTPTVMVISPEGLQVQSDLITLGAGILVLIILAGVLWKARRPNH